MTASTGNPLRKIYDWTLSLSKKISLCMVGRNFLRRGQFLSDPPDVLLIPLCLGAKKALRFAFICSVASVLGGLAGYAIGAIGWESLQASFYAYVPGFTEAKFENHPMVCRMGLALVFLAGFSPIPYKIFTIASGVLGMSLLPFLLASGLSKCSARFFLVAVLISKFGEPMKKKNRQSTSTSWP